MGRRMADIGRRCVTCRTPTLMNRERALSRVVLPETGPQGRAGKEKKYFSERLFQILEERSVLLNRGIRAPEDPFRVNFVKSPRWGYTARGAVSRERSFS